MEQHPVPQQISSYQFRLVGDMTLKQFFQIAGGAIVSLIIYSSNLPAIIKWPLIIISAIVGIALAFFPIEERPLEKWIIAFFRSIYSPTLFAWKKTANSQNFFQEETGMPMPKIIAPGGETALNAYLSAVPSSNISKKLEGNERNFLARMGDIFGSIIPTQKNDQIPITNSQQILNTQQPTINEQPKIQHLTVPASIPIPVNQPISRPRIIIEENVNQQAAPGEVKYSTVAQTMTSGISQTNSQSLQFSPDAAPPNPPTNPNTIAGQVMDEDGKIVEGAILEIRDGLARPVRALRTNKLGHFIVVTPLVNGRYEILTEKDNYVFTPLSFEAVGNIIPPFAIHGRSVNNQQTVIN